MNNLPVRTTDAISARKTLFFVMFLGFWLVGLPGLLRAQQVIRLYNGLELQGNVLELGSISENPFQAAGAGEVETKPLWMIDDGLRRTYLHQRGMVASTPDVFLPQPEKIVIEQPVPLAGKPLSACGTIIQIGPFNEFGRRTLRMYGPEGKPLTIFQGMTEITPHYIKLQALSAERDVVWESRIATDSVSDQVLADVFRNWSGSETLSGRLRIVQLLLQAERFIAARQQLEATIAQFPDEKRLEQDLKAIVQRQARQILGEAESRAEHGQPLLAQRMLASFPQNQVAREIRIQAADALQEMSDTAKLAQDLTTQLGDQVASLDDPTRTNLQPILEEISRDLSRETLLRLSDYNRLGSDESIPVENRVALAVGGWVLGSGSGLQNLPVAISLVTVRDRVAEYLAEEDPNRRAELLEEIHELEGATPENVAKMLRLMRPPLPLPESWQDEQIPGMYHARIPGRKEDEFFEYSIQLPPEYSPLREYPCIVTLPPLGSPKNWGVDWWAGPYRPDLGMRSGQATRLGYVVINPVWNVESQSAYRYTPNEHMRVLAAVRDAFRRVSIDTDRVFIAGHGYSAGASDGASAAWDIGLAHPDLWAGVIVIGAESEKYIQHYYPNGKYVPIYFVMGEIAGAPSPLIRNGADLNRYLKPGFDAMLVAYRGRGAEHFFEEIPHLFRWMELRSHRRPEIPQELELVTMRQGDEFFWWLEFPKLLDATEVDPILWDREGRIRGAAEIDAKVTGKGDVQILQAPAERFTVYLTPEMGIDLSDRVLVARGRNMRNNFSFDGRLDVMLEDVRTRADRKRPFWAKAELP